MTTTSDARKRLAEAAPAPDGGEREALEAASLTLARIKVEADECEMADWERAATTVERIQWLASQGLAALSAPVPDVAAERVAAEYVTGNMLRDPDRWRWTMHVTFINGDLNGIALVLGTVADVAKRIIERHAPKARQVSRTYPLGESDWPTELVYETTVTLDSGYTAEWRHVFRRPDEPWLDRAAALTTEAEGGDHA